MLLALVGLARADQMALDPQNRLHAGASWTTGPAAIGLQVGLDSRLTRVVALDFGAFAAPLPLDAEDAMPDMDPRETHFMRHGVYVTPGLRVPHGQPANWAWDVFVRAGGGVLFLANLDPDIPASGSGVYALNPALGGTGGADVLVRGKNLGLRAAGRVWMFEVVQAAPTQRWLVTRPQATLEVVYQW